MSGWRLVVKLYLQKELSVEVVRFHIDFSSKFDDVSQNHKFFSVSNEEGFCVE
jgi:hypothetical protein